MATGPVVADDAVGVRPDAAHVAVVLRLATASAAEVEPTTAHVFCISPAAAHVAGVV